MALINTTETIDTQLFLKAKLTNNMVGDNWYIENLQEKRNQDWEYRYNVIDIEEELNKQEHYTKELPVFTPIDAVIQTVKSDRGIALGDDWASLSFRDLNHPNKIGQRFRFDYTYDGTGFENLSLMSEEEKYYNTSIWLAVNKSSINPGNAIVVRRCNTNIALVGSPTRDYKNITEVRYEPAIIESTLNSINMYYNQDLVIPNAEQYITMQLNYFTNFITINDRIIVGGVDAEDKSNNTVYKVKAIVKTSSIRTFQKFGEYNIHEIPLITLGLDRDLADESDDYYKRIAIQSPLYPVVTEDRKNDIPYDEWIIEINEPEDNIILLGQTMYKNLKLVNSVSSKKYNFNFEIELLGVPQEEWDQYFKFDILQEDGYNCSFCIKNIKQYDVDYLKVKCSCNIPISQQNGVVSENIEYKNLYKEFNFELGGFY